MPPLRLSGRALVLAVAVALVVGAVALAVLGGDEPDGALAVTATTLKPARAASAAADAGVRALVSATTAALPPAASTTAAPAPASSSAPASDGGHDPPPSRPSRPTGVTASSSAATATTAASSSATSPARGAATTLVTTATTAAPLPVLDANLSARIVADHNRERAGRGLPPLQRSSCLDAIAGGWVQRMAATGTLLHNPTSAAQSDRCLSWQFVGENIGYDGTVEAMNAAWMDSLVHQANVLDADFTAIGVGVVRDDDGLLWAVVNFAG